MTVTTDIHHARERVADEREWTAEKRQAFDRFAAEIADIDARSPTPAAGPTGGPTTVASASNAGGGVSAVLSAFEEHLQEYSGEPTETAESVHQAVAAEFSTDIAVSLSGGQNGATLTPQLKQVVVAETKRRLGELGVMEQALEREDESLATAQETVATVCGWLVEHNPTSLSELGFEELRARHETLDEHREALQAAAAERQAYLTGATGGSKAVGIEHTVLVEYLYTGFGSDHPALATVSRLDECCETAQRTLRDRLTRRV